MIELIFHIQLNNHKNEFILNDYLSILSIINIQNPKKIHIYYHFNHLFDSFFYKSLIFNYNEEIFEFIEYKDNFYDKLKIKIKNGGIYIKNNFILLKKISYYLINECFFYEKCIFGFSKECFETSKNKTKVIIDQIFEIFIHKEDILRLKNNCVYEDLNEEDSIKIINDYNFYHYFKILDSFLFLKLQNIYKDNIILNQLKESKITYMNLIIYYILGYSYYHSPKNIELYKSKLNFIFQGISKIYWLNLNTSIERRKQMIKLLKYTSIYNQRIESYDGKKINNIREKYFKNSNIITNNNNCEYAIIISHLTMIKEAMKNKSLNKDDYILFLEDDIYLDFGDYWNLSIQDILNNAPKDCELIMLSYFTLNLDFKNDYREWNNDWSASAYVLKKSSLYKLNQYIDENNKYNIFDDVNVADNYLFRIFKTYVYKYPLFTISDNNTSTFHEDHDNYQKIYKNINYLILNNSIQKLFLFS